MLSNTVILFRTHTWDEVTQKHYQDLKNTGIDIFVLYDCTNRDRLLLDNAFNFTNDDVINNVYPTASDDQLDRIRKSNGLPESSKNIYHNCEQTVLMWYKSNPDHQKYQYYWSIEYDVARSGSWTDFFIEMDNLYPYVDFLAPFLNIRTETNWQYFIDFWESIDKSIDQINHASGLGMIHRYSKVLLDVTHVACINGFNAYYEQVMPTICRHYDLTMKDINWLYTDVEQAQYSALTMLGNPCKYWKSVMNQAQFQNKLFHPVKEFIKGINR